MLDRTSRRGRSAPWPWEFSARVGLKRKGENGAGGLQFARATFQHKQKKKKGKKKSCSIIRLLQGAGSEVTVGSFGAVFTIFVQDARFAARKLLKGSPKEKKEKTKNKERIKRWAAAGLRQSDFIILKRGKKQKQVLHSEAVAPPEPPQTGHQSPPPQVNGPNRGGGGNKHLIKFNTREDLEGGLNYSSSDCFVFLKEGENKTTLGR